MSNKYKEIENKQQALKAEQQKLDKQLAKLRQQAFEERENEINSYIESLSGEIQDCANFLAGRLSLDVDGLKKEVKKLKKKHGRWLLMINDAQVERLTYSQLVSRLKLIILDGGSLDYISVYDLHKNCNEVRLNRVLQITLKLDNKLK